MIAYLPPAGPPLQTKHDLGYKANRMLGGFRLTRDGSVAVARYQDGYLNKYVRFAGAAPPEEVKDLIWADDFDLSPDGKKLVLAEQHDAKAGTGLWIYDLAAKSWTPIPRAP